MRVTINLASRPFADIGPVLKNLRIAMGALALVAVVLGIGLHLLHTRLKPPAPASIPSTDRSPASRKSARATSP